jgi:hypothetical protein
MATPEELERLREQIELLTPEERLIVMEDWCRFCGGEKPCNCWNDE